MFRYVEKVKECFAIYEYECTEENAIAAQHLALKLGDSDVYTRMGLRRAKNFWNQGNRKESIKTLESLRPYILKHYGENDMALRGLYYQLGKCYAHIFEKRDKAILYLKKARQIVINGATFTESWQKKFNSSPTIPSHKVLGNISEMNRILSETFGYHQQYDSAIYYGEKARLGFLKSLDINPQISGAYIANIEALAQFYHSKGDYYSARKLILDSRKFLDENPNLTPTQKAAFNSNLYITLGKHYVEGHEYDKALVSLKKAKKDPNAYYYMGIVYMKLEKWDQATTNFKKSFTPYDSLDQGIVYNKLGKVSFKQENYDKSLQHYQKAISYLKRDNFETRRTKSLSLAGIGDVYLRKGNYQLAHKYYHRAKESISSEPFEKHVFLARFAIKIGNLYAEQNIFDKAFEQYQLSMNLLGAKVSSNKWQELPANFSTNYPDHFFSTIYHKTQTIGKYFEKTNNIADLETQIKHYEFLTGFSEYIRKFEFRNTSKAHWMKISDQISNSYIQAVLDFARLTKNPRYKEKAFSIADQNKASLLREALKESDEQVYSQIPKQIIQKELTLKSELAWYEKQAFDRKSNLDSIKIKEDSTLARWEHKLTELQITYKQLQAEIAKEYPEYFQAKYDLATITVSELQSNLALKNQTLIEYSLGDSSIYAFVISANSFQVFTLPKSDSLENWVTSLREGIYDYWKSDEQTDDFYQKTIHQYTSSAFKLYQELLAPIFLDQEKPKNLIIVPSGVLGYIPFGALITDLPQKIGNFGKYPFLIRDTEISYAFSVKLQLEMLRKQVNPTIPKILAVAPTFNSTSNLFTSQTIDRANYLAPLKYSTDEVKYLLKNFNAQIKTNELATKSKFLKLAPYFRFIHLATHAKVHDYNPNFSYIAFTQNADSISEDNLLYISEIYNLMLNVEMVVLSACETGLGELQKGEGIISMARAFAYAGAKSIITSLWSVDDRSTASIMKYFYHHLDHNERKSQALRNAKLDYINSHDNQAIHPFFWAPMIAMGDMSSVELNQRNNTFAWCLGIGFTFLIIMGFWYQRRKQFRA